MKRKNIFHKMTNRILTFTPREVKIYKRVSHSVKVVVVLKSKSKLKKIRESKSVTLADVANHAKIGISRYYMIESGDRPATEKIASDIANFFGIPRDDLFSASTFTVRELAKSTGTG